MSRTVGTLSLIVSRGFKMALQLVAVHFYFKWIGVTGYGMYVFAALIATYATIPDIGFNEAAQQLMARRIHVDDREGAERVHQTHAFVFYTLAVIAILICVVLAFTISFPGLPPGVSLVGPMAVIAFQASLILSLSLPYSVLQVFDGFGRMAKGVAYGAIGGTLLSLVLVYFFRSPFLVLLGQAVGDLCFFVVMLRSAAKLSGFRMMVPRWDLDIVKAMVKLGLKDYAGRLAGMFAATGDKAVVGKVIGASATGTLQAACRLPDATSDILIPIASSRLPMLSRSTIEGGAKLEYEMVRTTQSTLGAGACFMIVPAGFAAPFLRILVGIPVGEPAIVMLAYAVYRTCQLYYQAHSVCFYAVGKPQYYAPFVIYNALLTVFGTVPAAYYFGLLGIGWLNVFIALSIFLPIGLASRKIVAPTLDLAKYNVRNLLIMAVGLAYAMAGYGWSHLPFALAHPWLALSVMPIFVAVCLATLLVFRLASLPPGLGRYVPAGWRNAIGASPEQPSENLPLQEPEQPLPILDHSDIQS